MLFYKDLKLNHDYISFFKYLQELASDKKYKLPYFNHTLRRANVIIDNKVEVVYLSTWSIKNIRNVDFNRFTYSIIETFENNYTVQICKWGGEFPEIHFLEGFNYIPTLEEIDELTEMI